MPFLMTILLLLAYNCEAFTRQQKPACSRLLKDYHRDLGKHIVPSNTSNSFIFFLHVPRTAGKTYAQCFLRASSPPSTRCSPSYDFLRLNTSQAGCRYLVSHDDYSLTQVRIQTLHQKNTFFSFIKLYSIIRKPTPCGVSHNERSYTHWTEGSA